jgi:hypothetical protein
MASALLLSATRPGHGTGESALDMRLAGFIPKR